MSTTTFGQIYGRSFRTPSYEAATPGPSEAASGPDEIEEVSNPSQSPVIAVFAIIGALTALRMVWEFAEGKE